MTGFIYPNEATIGWDLLIVIYPYITGLVAGAFIVSSLYHVFGLNKLKPIARLSLVTALAFLLVSPLPLAIHLGRPERAAEMFLRPNFISAMSGFGYIWLMYLLLVLVEVWLVFRPDIVRFVQSSRGIKRTIYTVLSLGVTEISEASLAIDKKLIKLLAIIGIPAAMLLHGYVGFIFGAVKANPWWSTPLMPIIFLLSAIVSGIALLLLLYVLVTKIRRAALDYECLQHLALWLGGFLTMAVALEGLEFLSLVYEGEDSWTIIQQLITEKIALSYFGIQFGLGAVLPILVMGSTILIKMSDQVKTALRILSAFSILIGVFAMRWNVVIGGQMISKSLRGFTEYSPPLLGIEGILLSTVIMILPFLILGVLVYLLPPWQKEADLTQPRKFGLLSSHS